MDLSHYLCTILSQSPLNDKYYYYLAALRWVRSVRSDGSVREHDSFVSDMDLQSGFAGERKGAMPRVNLALHVENDAFALLFGLNCFGQVALEASP